MTKKQKVWTAVGAVLVIGLIIFGAINLFSKMDEVKELNNKIAEVDEVEGENDPIQPSPTDGNNPLTPDEDPEQSSDPSAPPISQLPLYPSEVPGTVPGDSSTKPEVAPKPTPSPGGNGGTDNTPPSNSSPDDKAKKKKEIDAATTTGMEKLRASCTAASNNLVNQIVQELNADEDASLESIQGDFLTDILAAEAKCDVQFNLLIGQAKEQYKAAGIDEQSLPDWSSEYESAKSQARASALTAITKALK